MKLIFIRHAEPDYATDSLTQKGFHEANLLANRTKDWFVSQFYCSPLGRTQATAAPTLKAHNVTLTTTFPDLAQDVLYPLDPTKALVYPWLRELHAPLSPHLHPAGKTIPWDFTPEFLQTNPSLFDFKQWSDTPIFEHCDVKNQFEWICNRLDQLLAQHGYIRDEFYYKTTSSDRTSNDFMMYDGHTTTHLQQAPKQEPTLVFFCHLGVMMLMISHLINTSPYAMLHGFFTPPASVTVLSAEERTLGHAYFRIQTIGDTSHLRYANEPVSFYGGFAAPFQW